MSEGDEIVRSFGWEDMWVAPEDDPRPAGGFVGERETLLEYLRGYRMTIELKCEGLDAAGMACRSVPPSDLSLLGLVRHLADVERHWFKRVLDGQEVANRFPHAAFDGATADPAVVEEAWAAWREEVSFAEGFMERAGTSARPCRTKAASSACARSSCT